MRVRLLSLFGSCAVTCAAGACDVTTTTDPERTPVPVKQPASSSPAASARMLGDGQAGPTSHQISPRVDLSGSDSHLAVNQVEPGPRVYAQHLRTWIYSQPDRSSARVGYLRAGGSTPVSAEPAGYRGCRQGWRAVKPEGYVCLGRRASLQPGPVSHAFAESPPRSDRKLPYRYGTVRNPGPVFNRLPTRAELGKAEPDIEERFPRWLNAQGEIGATFRQEVWEWGARPRDPRTAWAGRVTEEVPLFLQGDQLLPNPTLIPRPGTLVLEQMEPKVGYAFLDTFFHEGRRYGLTTHLELVPTDRLRPIVGSNYRGVRIGVDVDFPFAFVRRSDARYADGSRAKYREVLPLSGTRKFIGGRLHYETKSGKFISDRYASEIRPAKNMPGWAKKGEKWISVSIVKQALVLYEGTEAVYATLVSTGEAGLASPDETTATKRGIFRIHTKHITTTMSSDELGEEFELRDVPYVQYFAEGGYALHGAYWHDRFGTPKSHGCINLAPEDARRIFHWTEPTVPTGWHGALSELRGTVIFVHP